MEKFDERTFLCRVNIYPHDGLIARAAFKIVDVLGFMGGLEPGA
jgi:hypothetical protein